MKGFAPIYRKLFRPDYWLAPTKKHPAGRREAWIDLILLAQHDEYHHLSETLQQGEFVVSVRWLADRWKWSKSATQRFMDRLETEVMIGTVRGTPIGTVYRIVNYGTYADLGYTDRDTDRDTMRDTTGTHAGQEQTQTTKHNQQPPTSAHGEFPWDQFAEITVKGVRGQYGWQGAEGTRANVWNGTPPEDRDRILTGAMLAIVTEEKAETFSAPYLDSVIRRLVKAEEPEPEPDLSFWDD